MLYTIIPLERVYVPQVTSDNDQPAAKMERKDVSINNGVVSLVKQNDHYVVDRVWSTDMKDYLNTDYSPGSIMKL